MVKIALQFSGRMRFTNDSIQSIVKNIIEPYSPDVFCSFWNPEGVGTAAEWTSHIPSKSMEFENQHTTRQFLDQLFPFNFHYNMPSMSYKFYKVSELRRAYEKENNLQYDIVIQARSDNLFFEKLTMPDVTNGIWCSNRTYSRDIDTFISPRMVDNFYLGDRTSMDKAALTVWHLRSQAQEYANNSMHHHIRIPEIIQSKIWNDLNINIHSLPGGNPAGDFWYEIDRRDNSWK